MSGMKLRAEKKMRKHLIEQLKARKVLGARIAQGEKSAEDLTRLNMPPQLYVFHNRFSGQVLYSQVPGFHQDQIDAQFTRPNWQNRKPNRRTDLWKLMCVVNFSNHEYAVAAYHGLKDLRKCRDTVQQQVAKAMRKKDDDGNIWSSGQYRPTYAQEAVADLSHVIDEFELENTRVMWESAWRKGDDARWRNDLVEHETLPPFTTKYQTALMAELQEKAVAEFAAAREGDMAHQSDTGAPGPGTSSPVA
ncbi:mitochondrial ous recombination protein 1 [Yamadazyma tenuis]|uniref:Large ribosomal subunit protein mL67 n=1 Tax=Candida tenuis (strain ATCC 10573 / BCRC 21748 / CBS 615 / JCM 9827 / NBRC 10315 / NRRL Y-1498 / VKM Y-70) TaxID=590646 RepID=G3BDR2_CANTC|nr:mitochondrial homologous recombination protein 1 [Yamadazyma tenuis ATCC 10573]EGV60358.1 mitochondrial homologous recombination protein 1 [Yamadazyma tenuis ATCC 10573]WEJ94396.1 mitochondrial ous recombination protein 1 [Yamadazyma tenuis]